MDLTLSGTLEFANGLTAHFVCSFEGEPTYAAEVFGTEGKLLIPDPWLPPHWPTALILARGESARSSKIVECGQAMKGGKHHP